LAASNISGHWAALKLEHAPKTEDLPPLSGSVIPALKNLPPLEREILEREEAEIPDVESLILEDE
jgi:hypothetical protein